MRLLLAAAVALCALGLAGCGGDSGDTFEARLRVVAPDNNIREEGVECSGARPFTYFRRGAPYTIRAGDGTVVAEGELPSGTALNADPKIDWNVELIPTVCAIDLEVDLPERRRYRIEFGGGLPIEFERSLLGGEEPALLVLRG